MRNNKLIFVVDIRNWAFDRIARNLKKQLFAHYDAEILYWEDFSSVASFVKHINDTNPDIVHFFYREHLNLVIQNSDPKHKPTKIFCSRVITTHIPDYLYSDPLSLLERRSLFHFVDGYFTTNDDLFKKYTQSDLIKPPISVIFDWPELSASSYDRKLDDGRIRILWCGNSKWGEYAGRADYKGLRTVIEPAIAKLRAKFTNIDFICYDSANCKKTHSEVLAAMNDAHIVLIASEEEGTPLTLLEAMANSCAIITTRVGIAPQIMPDDQRKYIVERSPTTFMNALSAMVADTENIERLGSHNCESWKRHFCEGGPLLGEWLRFFEKATDNFHKTGADKKLSFLNRSQGSARKALIMAARSGGRVASRLGLVNTLNRLSPRFGMFYQQLVYGSGAGKVNYDRLASVYDDILMRIDVNEPVVIYSPMWKGVAASTQSLFPSNSIAFPFTDGEYPEQEKHSYLEAMALKLSSSDKNMIIYSGGSLIHYHLARRIKEIAPDKKQLFMWHGSPAQWVNRGEKAYFLRWKDAYDNGVISGIITLKQGLDVILQKMGIDAWRLFNPIPQLADLEPAPLRDVEKIKIGIFSAISSWYKNPYPQLLSLAGKQNVELTTNLSPDEISTILPDLHAVEYRHHVPRNDFLNILKKQHINLYVTNTECSPMIALESWSYLIPCIVSPAGDIYSSVSKELADWLVEPCVDDAHAISQRLDKVIANYSVITKLLLVHREEQRKLFLAKKAELYQALRLN